MKMIGRSRALLFLLAEVIFLVSFYFLGTQGISYWSSLQQENVKVEERISVLEQEIAMLEGKIADWQTNEFFYKEKIAREQLQMARKSEDETIYFLQ